LRWDDKITENLSYGLAVISPIIKRIKSLKDATLAINGGDLANGQFTKLRQRSGKTIRKFYL
jgi:hypothetical protein